MERGCHGTNPVPQAASYHPRASTLTKYGRRESCQGQGPVSGPASTRTPLHTEEGESKRVMLAPGTPTAKDGAARVAERAD